MFARIQHYRPSCTHDTAAAVSMVAWCWLFDPETYVNARQGCFKSNVYTSLSLLAVS